MRLVSLCLAVFLCLSFTANAQVKPVQKAVIKTPTVLCEVCSDRLTFFISHEPGVISVNVNTRAKTTTVSWYTDRTNIENIKAAIANLGYDADDIEGLESEFKLLPKACKAHREAARAAAQKAATPASTAPVKN